jgi:PBP4 family serine-type D-alanyl-D-alanine carboxypeptidase
MWMSVFVVLLGISAETFAQTNNRKQDAAIATLPLSATEANVGRHDDYLSAVKHPRERFEAIRELRASINDVLKSPLLRRAEFAAEIISAETGEVLFAQNSNVPMMPASTMKLFTTGTVLAKLTARHTFKTIVYTDDQKIADGIINGNLYIKGFGDPDFNTWDLENLVQAVRNAGVRQIKGDVIADESYFDNLYERSDWIEGEPENARVGYISALSINRNTLTLSIEPNSRTNKRAEISVSPATSYVTAINKTTTVAKKVRKRLSIGYAEHNDGIIITVDGQVKRRSNAREYHIAIRQPALFTAALLKDRLRRYGVAVQGKNLVGKVSANVRELARHEHPFRDILARTNKHSDNFFAECLLKTVDAELNGGYGSAQGGVAIIARFMREIGVDTSAYSVVDGSGLSRKNKISADAMVKLLRYIYNDKAIFETFYNSLPIAGVDGTLGGRMIGTRAANNARGKTGTLSIVASLSGFVNTQDDELLIFSLNASNFSSNIDSYRHIIDRIVAELAGFSRNKIASN